MDLLSPNVCKLTSAIVAYLTIKQPLIAPNLNCDSLTNEANKEVASSSTRNYVSIIFKIAMRGCNWNSVRMSKNQFLRQQFTYHVQVGQRSVVWLFRTQCGDKKESTKKIHTSQQSLQFDKRLSKFQKWCYTRLAQTTRTQESSNDSLRSLPINNTNKLFIAQLRLQRDFFSLKSYREFDASFDASRHRNFPELAVVCPYCIVFRRSPVDRRMTSGKLREIGCRA